jgi:hypothetical protein
MDNCYKRKVFQPSLPTNVNTLIEVTTGAATVTSHLILINLGVGNLFITAGRVGCSHLCQGLQKRINNVMDSKQNSIFLAGIPLKQIIAVFLYTSEFPVKTLLAFRQF